MELRKIMTSESVGKGHPDKICDQISDAVLDECLKQDPNSKVACEVFAANRLIVIGGEITTAGYVDVVKMAWNVLIPLGYDESDFTIISNVNSQSNEIFNAVEKDNQIGAGDQGVVYGYATDECENFMPLPINIAHDLVKCAEQVIWNTKIDFIKHDMKSQVTIDYADSQNPKIDQIIMSVQHSQNATKESIESFCNAIIDFVVKKYNLNSDFKRIINNSGKFTIGGPIGDTGLTGRKLMVDTYGSLAKHGGGAFSGKDCTKVDRSGAYFARYIAKNIVAAKLAKKCEVQLSFAIGASKPIAFAVDTFGTSKYSDEQIYEIIVNTFDFSIKSFIEKFNMRSPIYSPFSTYGHFGRTELNPGWEQLDKVEEILEFTKKYN
ncbi:methionine adenosyltransferase [Malacoplasma penetrans]|uniref:Methionine adenosyltransferase n=1 Tax=Malacoplasma penetrans (strain HF-2) TaxID=272633 RepID=Q8EWV5_MALP2|nr:methionine adenosyltransferase [Malacoplasma penetrans]RXY97328.1 methionine adenosyltransferase [Malacoplasma penetrans]BAC43885.1 S-adenosylmethionine synthetase [Malacoplasma penetrans HF-2]